MNRMIFAGLLCGAILPHLCFGQKLSVGVVAGTSVTGDFQTGTYAFPGGVLPDGRMSSTTIVSSPLSRTLIVGPKLELTLPRKLSLEIDALHREMRSKTTDIVSPPYVLPDGTTISAFGPFERTNASWEIPVLLKYTLAGRTVHPFFHGGPSFRAAGTGTNLTHYGVTAGGGVELRLGGLKVSPEVRYTRWTARPGTGTVPVAIQNQVEVLAAFDAAHPTEVFGAKLSVGVVAGVALGDDLRPQAFAVGPLVERPDSNSPVVGLMLEIPVHRNLFVEANGIYRALHATDFETGGGSVRFAVLTWEFPLLAKCKFRPTQRIRPFAELGPSFRADGNFNGPRPSHIGVTGGAGAEVPWWKTKISPVVRYTRWTAERLPTTASRPSTFVNEVELLAGISF